MRMPIRDTVATLLVAAIVVSYAGFLAGASMPFVHDTLGMAATAFILWVAVFLVAGRYQTTTAEGIAELVLFAVSLTLGAGAVLAAEMLTGLAPALLAVFVGTAVVTWTVRLWQDIGRWQHRGLTAH